MIYMINPVKQRFYWLLLQQDIFGTWCVHKVYGGLTNRHCRESWVPFPTKEEAQKALTEVEYIRRQRGYIYADIKVLEYFHLKPQTIAEVLANKVNQLTTKIKPVRQKEQLLNPNQQLLFTEIVA